MRTTCPSIPDVLQGVENGAAICVLASGSGGNCSVLALRRGSILRIVLLDLGLSARKTFKLLADRGIRPDQIDDAIVTHLDADHFNVSWLTAMPPHVRIRMHEGHERALHAGEGSRGGAALGSAARATCDRIHPFELEPFDIDEGVTIRPHLMSHDEAGVSTLRIDMPGLGAGSMGFCTDLGHVTSTLVDHLRADYGAGEGLDVLAIESNYCPRMQLASPRPEFLKRRIMGGSGHLSNQEALDAVRAISPREHVVLLHLSRDCNDPALVSELHAGGGSADYALTIASQYNPTRWIRIARGEKPLGRPLVTTRVIGTGSLFAGVSVKA